MSLMESARTAVKLAQSLGAQEAKAVVSRGSEVELEQRARTLERVKESSTAFAATQPTELLSVFHPAYAKCPCSACRG